ncbi:MAG: DUF4249 domain-containing protein [Cyclobacteriaceae bacterium]|nr:DUF4249 domain-containing protein [Cyclobacteriaceae bacterium]
MKRIKNIPAFLLLTVVVALGIQSCEDKINPTLENAAPILAVDAWLNNKAETQVISLTSTQPYFQNVLPPGVSGAVVTVRDNSGKVYSFIEDDKKPGNYLWKPSASEVFGKVGDQFTLTIQTNGETFQSVSFMGRVPVIDSISFDTEKRIGATDSITQAEFWATDPLGPGDAYWIRTFKNGVALLKPSELNVAFDAGFSPGGRTDGVIFITPIRRGINSNDTNDDGTIPSPIKPGDSINVQINSITKAAFEYLNQVSIQTNRPGGFQELFSTPLANVSTNINNVNPNGSKAVGFFNVSAVSIAGKRFKKKK